MAPKQDNAAEEKRSQNESVGAPPIISLPKGGGAIRGIGEKFAANPVTGTGSTTVPIATSPGRSGFDPKLSLFYDSGAGNGPFGMGWNLSIPRIAIKTDKRLPKYSDTRSHEGSFDGDTYILSGSEDLVPVLGSDGKRFVDEASAPGYVIHRYRPRIEGLFARIERWTHKADGIVHWRSISKENILSIYGGDANSQIADPTDAMRIFGWLICETRDDKGNAILYRYKAEDGVKVDLTLACERNRGPVDDNGRTANRYLKNIYYGNRTPLLNEAGRRPRFLDYAKINDQIANGEWMFEVVFDYGEHDPDTPKPNDTGQWDYRLDPFSSYRSGFEIRTSRLCQRVLMFHHFEGEQGVGRDCLVRSTDITYSYEEDPHSARNPVYTFLRAVTPCGYRRENSAYVKRSLPSVEFAYTQPVVQDTVEEVDSEGIANLPIGLDGKAYQLTDLHGEGIPGILAEEAGGWFYKRNLSALPIKLSDGRQQVKAHFAALETVAFKPNLSIAAGAQFMNLAGDGQPDVVMLDGPMPGLYEHDEAESWLEFRPFASRLNRDMRDPNLRFVDLDGDGHADVLITESDAFIWHESLAEDGFGAGCPLAQCLNEEEGPRMVFADGTQSIYLADMSGDGLTDLVRINCGEVCYWPNLGYGRFGAKVTMGMPDGLGHGFDHPEQFDHSRIRLADIDGSGTTDIIYLHQEGVRIYFNQSGNSWSAPQLLNVFPRVDDLAAIACADLLGNGTACLVWSSPLPSDAQRPMRYVNLMGDQKPHLLISINNNLGVETRVKYAPSTRFYLEDRLKERPWITRLPFPVYVVERVETYDRVSRSRFVTRHAYHHGYFDGEEREFRGFGMVEQWDTDEIGSVAQTSVAGNLDSASFVSPVHTKTWFHTGAVLEGERISRLYESEYYRDAALSDSDFQAQLLADTVLPPECTLEEEREACRALKGAMLRREVYAHDAFEGASAEIIERAKVPYIVTEQNFTIERLQARSTNRHAVFFTHAREVITYHYDRNPQDPRISHLLTLEVDPFGNVLRSAAVGYPRQDVPGREAQQNETHVTFRLNQFANRGDSSEWYRVGFPAEARTYEVVKPPAGTRRIEWQEMDDLLKALVPVGQNEPSLANTLPYEHWNWREKWNEQTEPGGLIDNQPVYTRLRLIEHVRTLFRKDDLTGFSPVGEVESLALPGETYKLAFTPGLLAQVYKRKRGEEPEEDLLPSTSQVLGGMGADGGGYVDLDASGQWWISSGKIFYSPTSTDLPAQELAFARRHFFLPHRYRNAFGQLAFVSYDSNEANPARNHDLLVTKTEDAGHNIVTALNDYRVLEPRMLTDSNGNRSEARFDALGMVVGTAVMGKAAGTTEGDMLDDFIDDLPPQHITEYFDAVDSRSLAYALLGKASTRTIYDLHRVPACAATISRETHVSELAPNALSKLQLSFSYSDGLAREIQKKIQAEPGPVPQRDASGNLVIGANGRPQMTANDVSPRWVASGWTLFNNKGKPVRQYEPFFSDTHKYEFDVKVGVSPVLFYDPLGRVVATLHPNHTWEKVVFGPWQQTTYDVNDTVLFPVRKGDPRRDRDMAGFFEQLPDTDYLPTWHEMRTSATHAAALAAHYPDPADRASETLAAIKAAGHADTPATAYVDTLGRSFLTVAHNKVACAGHTLDGTDDRFFSRVMLDSEGNQRAVRDADKQAGDAQGRIVMRYEYDMLGNRIYQASMEAGKRWILNDVTGKALRVWDSRGHNFRNEYDPLRRPLRSFVSGADPNNPGQELRTEEVVYGEQQPQAESRNLRGKLYQHFDQAGLVTNDQYDFKGNLLRSERQLAQTMGPPGAQVPAYKATVNWSGAVQLEATKYVSRTHYDALNRPIRLVVPHSDQANAKINIIRPIYNEANLLEQVHAWLGRNAQPADLPDPSTADLHAVTNIDYDAKGQRQSISYGNGAQTFYNYDPYTFRLTRLLTKRNIAAVNDCPPSPPPGWPGCQVQNLHYCYDPAGNVIQVRDEAQQTIYFKNKRVEPSAEYTYDALYRLIKATGREHLGQTAGNPNAPTPHGYNDASRVKQFSGDGNGQFAPNDGKAMGTFSEHYVYDAVGNFLEMQHRGSDPAHPGWTRLYSYKQASLNEDGTGGTLLKTSNRVSSTTIGNGTPETYSYDAHGNMLGMPQLQVMQWDYRNELQMTQRQKVNNDDVEGSERHGERTWYVYDAAGQRVRKVTQLAESDDLKDERIYLGGFEIYRRHAGLHAGLVRETLHIRDGKQRIALAEMRTQGNDPAPAQLIRYQFGNNLGSVSLELDEEAQIISYEEYTPYGSTAYQAVRSKTETPKRYRYTGQERDEESGLFYYGARYYASWLAKWTSADPSGIRDGLNLYVYVRSSPLGYTDPDGRDSKPITIEGELVVIDASGKITKATKSTVVVGKPGEKAPPPKERQFSPAELSQAQSRVDAIKKIEQQKSDVAKGPNSVVFSNPMGETKYGEGRGAGGPQGHGLDKDLNTSDWSTKAAKDMMAPVGTPVRAATDGTIEWITLDTRAEHTGKIFGDQVTIKSSNGAMKTFYTHIDLDDEIKRQWDNGKGAGKITVKRGQVIGWVTTWKDSPSGTHLHFSTASKRPDGSYKGVDPTPLLDTTKGTTEAHDVTFSEDGGYTAGDRQKGTALEAAPMRPPVPEQTPGSAPSDLDCVHPNRSPEQPRR